MIKMNGDDTANSTVSDEEQDMKEVSLKSFFLGPQSENQDIVENLSIHILKDWFEWRKNLYPGDGNAISDKDRTSKYFVERKKLFETNVDKLLKRFRNEIPTFTPRYIGHMVTEISLPALMGHIITLLHNPNNITGEASRVGIKIEDEAIQDLAEMVGYDTENSIGHFTSGGTVANFEGTIRARARLARWLSLGALAKTQGHKISLFEAAHMGWDRFENLFEELETDDLTLKPYHLNHSNPIAIAKKLNAIFDGDFTGPVMLVPNNKHYCWEKAVTVLGFGEDAFWPVDIDERGKLDVSDLRAKVEKARKKQIPILMVVSVAGTTELGDFDPVDEVEEYLEELREEGIHIWHHVDAAYGGFFCAIGRDRKEVLTDSMISALDAISKSNSLTVDPHKLGYVPYSSGAFLCREQREYYSNSVKAPYINFDHMHDKGPQTLEGSRSAGGAVSTWLTSKSIGFNPEGYGTLLEKTIEARIHLEQKLENASPIIRVAPYSETNIACFCLAKPYEPTELSNKRTLNVYKAYAADKNNPFFVSKTDLTFEAYGKYLQSFIEQWGGQVNTDSLTLIRLTLMNPFFETEETDTNFSQAFIRDLLKTIQELK